MSEKTIKQPSALALALADAMCATAKFNAETNLVEGLTEGAIAGLAETDVSADLLKRVQVVEDALVGGIKIAVGRTAKDAMVSDDTIAKVSGSVNIGRDSYTTNLFREKSFVNPQDKANPIVKKFCTSVDVQKTAPRNNGQVKIAGEYMQHESLFGGLSD